MSVPETSLIAITTALAEYANLDDTEYGEYCSALILLSRKQDLTSAKFSAALLKEMKYHLNSYRKYAKIVQRQQSYTNTFNELEWEQ